MGLAGLIAVELEIMTGLPTFAQDLLAHVRLMTLQHGIRPNLEQFLHQ